MKNSLLDDISFPLKSLTDLDVVEEKIGGLSIPEWVGKCVCSLGLDR